MTIKRNTKFIPLPTKAQIEEIKRLNNLFYENDHILLRGGRIKRADSDSLSNLYYHFFKNVDNYDWSKDLIDMELDNLKHDRICGKNTNKTHWSKSILLGWVIDLPKSIDAEYLYRQLSSRESSQRIIKFAYWH